MNLIVRLTSVICHTEYNQPVMKKCTLCFALLFWMVSIPAFSQNKFRPFYIQLSYGQSFFWTNSAPRYTFTCPEIKLGVGFTKDWNRIGMSAGLNMGIRDGTSKEFAYQMYMSEAKLYMLMQERYYSSALEFLEVPVTAHYYLVQDRLSIHAGLSVRRYLIDDISTSGVPGYLESIQIDRYNFGILSMLKFRISPRLGASIDYFFGLKKLNATASLHSNQEYHLTGSFAQISLFVKPFHARNGD